MKRIKPARKTCDVSVGDRFRGLHPSNSFYTLTVVGFQDEPYGRFAVCERVADGRGEVEKVPYAVDLLQGGVFYEKISRP